MLTLNYHFIERCNANCKFCFARDLGCSYVPSLDEQLLELKEALKEPLITKVSFVGGEPTLNPNLAPLARYCKSRGLTTMLITNGSRLTTKWFEEHQGLFDWIGLSVDSFNEDTNKSIGRPHVDYCRVIEDILHNQIKLKLNTVVCRLNKDEIFPDIVRKADRWKIFQVFLVDNAGQKADTKNLVVTGKEFRDFLAKNNKTVITAEDNDDFRGSYLMMNPKGQLFNDTYGFLQYSEKVSEIGIQEAMKRVEFNIERYKKRGGVYNWS